MAQHLYESLRLYESVHRGALYRLPHLVPHVSVNRTTPAISSEKRCIYAKSVGTLMTVMRYNFETSGLSPSLLDLARE